MSGVLLQEQFSSTPNNCRPYNNSIRKRFRAVAKEAKSVRSSLYHLTNQCNLRCKGCWFFSNEFDKNVNEVTNLMTLENFVQQEAERGINSAILIGGEPTIYPERVEVFRKYMDKITVSTNGLKKLPYEGFEDVTLAISLFGGGKLDDELRAIGPNGKTFAGLFDRNLKNYAGDPRAGFVYAISEQSIPYMENTIRMIGDHGLRVMFNYYIDYDKDDPMKDEGEQRLLLEALRLKAEYPDVVISHPYYIKTLITGKSHWDAFGYEVCPSVSQNYENNQARIVNGNPTLPKFNAWTSDLSTPALCCTSGECEKCRDSQAVASWLLINFNKFLKMENGMQLWTELSESYFSQFIWSKYHPKNLRNNVEPVEPAYHP